MIVCAVDPGNRDSAYVLWDGKKALEFDKASNDYLRDLLDDEAIDTRFSIWPTYPNYIVFEKVASYGMPVGEDVFETVYWTGRFIEAIGGADLRVPRKDVKMHLCKTTRAKDSNVIMALVDRFDPERKYGKYGKGTKKEPGPFYGFSKDVWQAFALAVYWHDLMTGEAAS